MAILLELHYLPPVQFFTKFLLHQPVYIEQHENYRKGSYRNRCHLAGANGVLRLSVPLKKGKNQQLMIRDVRLSYDEPWQAQHWQSIQSAYGNAPFFEFYADYIQPFFTKKYEFLFDWNWNLLLQILELLELPQPERSPTFWQQPPEGIEDGRNMISPKEKSMPDAQFEAAPYMQVFAERHGFLPNLSILDLLFCTGQEARLILEASIVKSGT